LFKRKKQFENSFDPSLFLFLLLLFFFLFSLSSIFIKSSLFFARLKNNKICKEPGKKKKTIFFLKKNANQEDGTSFPPRKSYFKKTNSNKVFLKNIFLTLLFANLN